MDRQLKQRVVGAAVLVALGVIFIPIILQNDNLETRLPKVADIPEQPDDDFISRVVPLEESDIESLQAQTRLPVEPPRELMETVEPAGDPVTAIDSDSNGGTDDGPQVTAEANTTPEAASTPVPDPRGQATDNERTAAANEADGTTEDRLAALAWTIQVGSFASESNATGLEAKLRKAGLAAYVKPVDDAGKKVYKVRVGPQRDRAEAASMRRRLSEAFELKGLLLRYP